MKRRVVCGETNYEELVRKHGYFVEKTRYVKTLEMVENPVFLRPRRFGKPLWRKLMEYYCNIRQQDQFQDSKNFFVDKISIFLLLDNMIWGM